MIKEASKKVDILVEALPYIKRFHGKVVVVKYGGSAVEQAELNHTILEDITFMNQLGMHPVVVHGAGPFISKKMKEAGLEVKFVNGMRVTDKETLAIAEQALAEVNRNIIKELKELGNEAKGFVGRNGELITAKKKPVAADIGYVGEVTGFDKKLIYSLLQAKIIPVVAPLGVGEDGELYNLNADTVAAEIARAMHADKMVILTNVQGIMEDINRPESLISSIDVAKLQELIEKKVVSGGMIPKVNACIQAANSGVAKTHIINAQIPHALLLEIYTEQGIGTEILSQKQ
ncbi:MAG: acetylglutamate kinase [Candidatus Omnitrophica bacterium]|nr:acetylglutamate kinase [Candidatus Omnitrophota bacterium]MBU1924699.1 acetylglutamate kinase [Candidatus Omnitrophota bacterium]MBU2063733.1 acetylglutamate kinase [Candidatus Omnitrophota bacterium]